MFAHSNIVQDYRAHANQAVGLDRATVKHDAVPYRDVILENKWILGLHDVADRAVLNIGVLADANEMNVAANDAVVPDAGMVLNLNVSDDLGAFRNVNSLSQLRPFALILVQHSTLRIKTTTLAKRKASDKLPEMNAGTKLAFRGHKPPLKLLHFLSRRGGKSGLSSRDAARRHHKT